MTAADPSPRKGVPVLGVAAAVAVAVVGLAAASPGLALAVVIGVPLVIVPGWALSLGVAPSGWPDPLSRWIAILGFGLLATLACGLLLGASPVGLGAPAWIASTSLVTVASLGVAWRRGARLRVVGSWTAWELGVPAGPLVVGSLVVLAAGISLGLARAGAEAQPQSGFTQLWIEPAGEGRLRLGVASQADPATYRLEVRRGADPLRTWDGIQLADGQTWTGVVDVSPGGADPVVARLYRSPGTDIYRSVTWWPEDTPGPG